MYFQRIICCCCVGLTRHRFDSPKSRLTNKNSSNRHTRGGYTVAHSLPNSSPPTTQTLLAVLAQTLTQPKPQTQLLLSHHSPHPTQPSAAETKSQWKRSTMETQIQQAPVTSSCREQRSAQQQQPPGSGTNRAAVECIMERPADGSSSPLCLSINNSIGERQRVKIKYISCDEDNNPVELSPKQMWCYPDLSCHWNRLWILLAFASFRCGGNAICHCLLYSVHILTFTKRWNMFALQGGSI